MSSYIPSAKHFNSCQAATVELLTDSDFYFGPIREICPGAYHRDAVSAKAEFKKMFDTLRRLTVLCVSLQYKNHYTGRLDSEIKEQTEVVFNSRQFEPLNKYGLLKCLGCIQYQIEPHHLEDLRELTEDEKNALEFLEKMQQMLALHLVRNAPNYEKAPYSI
jgi:hypothetical protein